MNTELTREFCMSLPHVTENVQWGADLLFKIGGKMFAVMSLEPSKVVLSFKATPEKFFELQEVEGVIPAPYMARNQWLALQRWDALRDAELRDLLRTSYELVFAKLPKKLQEQIGSGKSTAAKPAVGRSRKKSPAKSPKKPTNKTPRKRLAKKSTPKKKSRR